jgi:hypothetical protein
MPAGMTFGGGLISGIPTTPGTSNLTFRATNADGCTGTQSIAITVVCPTMTVTPASLATAIEYVSYNQPLTISGGTAPYTWTVVGALPTGITLNSSTGALAASNVTGAPGNYPITINVSDSFGCASTKAYTLVVQALDYGDASQLPSASSVISSGLKMGALVDADVPGLANATATGDDNNGTDDEDGVTFAPMTMGLNSLVSVKVTNTTGSPAYLNAWIDFDGNGTMGPGEQIITDQVIATGANNINVDNNIAIPAVTFEGNVVVRFRLTNVASPGIGGNVGIGEVEDYIVQLCSPKPCGKTFVTQN